MKFSYGDEKFEAWIETTEDGKRLNEHVEQHTTGTATQSPMLECFAECKDNTEFCIILQRSPTNKVNTAFSLEIRINDVKHLYCITKDRQRFWLKEWPVSADKSASLTFAAMDVCDDPDERPEDRSTVGTIVILMTPGTLTPRSFYPGRASGPTEQRVKPQDAKLGSTVIAGTERDNPPVQHYDFKPLKPGSLPFLTLRWKYRNRLKLVLMDIIEDPLLKALVPREWRKDDSAPGETLGKRKRSLSPVGSEDGIEDGSDDGNDAQRLRKRLKAHEVGLSSHRNAIYVFKLWRYTVVEADSRNQSLKEQAEKLRVRLANQEAARNIVDLTGDD